MSLTVSGTAHALGTNPLATSNPVALFGWFKGNVGQFRRYFQLASSANSSSYVGIGTNETAADGRAAAFVQVSSSSGGQTVGAVLTGTAWNFQAAQLTSGGTIQGVVNTNAKTSGGSGFSPPTLDRTIVSGNSAFNSGLAGQFAHLGGFTRLPNDLEWSYLGAGGNPQWLGYARYWRCAATETATITDYAGQENLTCTSVTAGTDDPVVATYWTAAALANQTYTQGVPIGSIDWKTKFDKPAAAVDYTTSLVQRSAAGTPSTATAAATSASNVITLADASAFSVNGYASITTSTSPLLILAKSGNTLLLGGFVTWAASANVYPFSVSAKTFTFYTSGNTFSGTPAAGDVGTITVIPRAVNNTNPALIADGPAFQITVASSGAAPSFSAGPTLTSSNSDGYTFGATSNQVATGYLLTMVAGSAAPSQAQMLSGSPTGFVSRVTQAAGSGTPFSISSTGLTNPVYDEYLMLNNGSGSSAVVPFTGLLKAAGATQQYVTAAVRTITAVTKANPCKITSAGHGLVTGNQVEAYGVGGMVELNALFTAGTLYPCTVVDVNNITIPVDSTGFTTYTSGGSLAWGNSIDKDASTPVANGDVRILDAVTTPDGCAVICQPDGSVAIQMGDATQRQTFTANVYSKSLNALVGAATEYFQDVAPLAPDVPGITIPAIFIAGNQAIAPVNLAALASDVQGDTLTATVSGLPATLSVTSSVMTGSLPAGQIAPITITWTNRADETVSLGYNLVASPITPPNLQGLSQGVITALLSNYYLSPTFGSQDNAADAGTAIAQNPPFGIPVQANATINVTLSTGVVPITQHTVPDVSSAPTDQATAVAAIVGSGFQAVVAQAWTGVQKITQYPAGGSVIDVGSVVTLFLTGGAPTPKRHRPTKKAPSHPQKPRTRIIVQTPGKNRR